MWASEESIRRAVEAAGVAFHALETSGWRWPDPSEGRDRFRRALDVSLSEAAVARATGELLKVIDRVQPDVVIGEPYVAAAAIAAEKTDAPYAVCGHPAIPSDQDASIDAEREAIAEGRARLQRLFARFNVRGRNWPDRLAPWPRSPELHVVYWTIEWYSDLTYVESQTHFVGGVAEPASGSPPTWFEQLPHDAPLAFITLGSLFTDDPDFFVIAAHACVQAGVFPILALGRSPRAPDLKQQLAQRLPRCIVASWVDYAHVFPHLSLVIHHGGMGTTHAAVTHALPQLIIPHAADQSLQARRAEMNGVGRWIAPREATADHMRQPIDALLGEPYRKRARDLAASFAAAGGAPQAARLIAALAHDETLHDGGNA
jgi:MGT family glycosyltransferase